MYGRDGLQDAPASILEQSKARTPPWRTQMRVVAPQAHWWYAEEAGKAWR